MMSGAEEARRPVGSSGGNPRSPEDASWLARAIALGETARGLTSPNPPVGCVLVRDGRIVGEGATRPTGGPHAEAVALADAGAAATASTAYVTLEPCSHQGRTPPCADALIRAGVRRVVIGHADPNPVAGNGADRLRAAGCDVTGPPDVDDLFRQVIARQLEGFLMLVQSDRPHVTLKIAQTPDGQMEAPSHRLGAPNDRRWITGPLARRAVHRWRAAVDGVLVGSGTVLADDPRLNVRDEHDDPASRQPRPVVFDGRLRLPPTAAVLRPGAIVVTSPVADESRIRALRAAGVEVEVVPVGTHGGVSLRRALSVVARHGVVGVLAEPGRRLGQALMDADLVDRLVVHVGNGDPGTVIRPAMAPAPKTTWRLERCGGAGPDIIVQYTRDRSTRRRDQESA